MGVYLDHAGVEDDDKEGAGQRATLADPNIARESGEVLARSQEGGGGFAVKVDDYQHIRVITNQPPQALKEEAVRDAWEGGFHVNEQKGRGRGPLHG